MSVLEGKTLLKEMEMLKKVEQDEVDLKKNKKNVFIIPCFTIFLVFITTKFNLITTFLNKWVYHQFFIILDCNCYLLYFLGLIHSKEVLKYFLTITDGGLIIPNMNTGNTSVTVVIVI